MKKLLFISVITVFCYPAIREEKKEATTDGNDDSRHL